jgi:hypothetical protein
VFVSTHQNNRARVRASTALGDEFAPTSPNRAESPTPSVGTGAPSAARQVSAFNWATFTQGRRLQVASHKTIDPSQLWLATEGPTITSCVACARPARAPRCTSSGRRVSAGSCWPKFRSAYPSRSVFSPWDAPLGVLWPSYGAGGNAPLLSFLHSHARNSNFLSILLTNLAPLGNIKICRVYFH